MKKLLMVLSLMSVGIMASGVRADEPAIVNNPGNAWDNFKDIVSMAEPSGDVLLDTQDGEVRYGSSIELYSAKNLSIPVLNDLDSRLGWVWESGAYFALSFALDRVTGKEILRFAHIGYAAGYDFEDEEFFAGPIVGAKVNF